MSEKPSYLGLLNAVAVGEGNAHCYFTEWAARTPSDEVRAVLSKVAAREGEHAMSFARRIDELGYQVRRKEEDPSFDKAMAVVCSDRTDLEKMKKLGLHKLDTGDEPDVFDSFFANHSIDIRTGELLGRYIAEERDTGRLLRSCYEQLKAAERGAGDAAVDHDGGALASLEAKVDALCRAVDELRQIVCAQSMPAPSSSRPSSSRPRRTGQSPR
jgi:rubrerythrin